MAVTNTINNIFCGINKDKMTTIVEEEELISEEQNDFRKNRRGTENLYLFRQNTYLQNKKHMLTCQGGDWLL